MREAALVTGGAKRIGKEICIYLARNNYDIALNYNTSSVEARNAANTIESLGVNCKLFKFDLSKTAGIKKFTEDVFGMFPNCTLLVNNASVFNDHNFNDITLKDFDDEFNINFKSPFFLTQLFSRRKQSRNIINLLDTRVSRINSSHFVYNLSKDSLLNFTRMTAKSLSPAIRINAICPGDILPLEGMDNSYLEKRSKRLPVKKVGCVNNVILALEYLLKNEFVTGECLFVDGGEHLL